MGKLQKEDVVCGRRRGSENGGCNEKERVKEQKCLWRKTRELVEMKGLSERMGRSGCWKRSNGKTVGDRGRENVGNGMGGGGGGRERARGSERGCCFTWYHSIGRGAFHVPLHSHNLHLDRCVDPTRAQPEIEIETPAPFSFALHQSSIISSSACNRLQRQIMSTSSSYQLPHHSSPHIVSQAIYFCYRNIAAQHTCCPITNSNSHSLSHIISPPPFFHNV